MKGNQERPSDDVDLRRYGTDADDDEGREYDDTINLRRNCSYNLSRKTHSGTGQESKARRVSEKKDCVANRSEGRRCATMIRNRPDKARQAEQGRKGQRESRYYCQSRVPHDVTSLYAVATNKHDCLHTSKHGI
eukprot:GHVQ01013319.1.p2 GENE.GHVQ01013319.1~~GHVQ01013319.1.p2  ORF type:complete len:134 (+),score=17.11 GHVQ01013319.1:1382-1783(+)